MARSSWRTRHRLRALASVWAVPYVFAGTAPSAAASDSGGGAPMAESLFREAKQLAAAGDYDEACPKFAESHRIDPQLGTLLHLATCHEQQGKTASAWAEYGEAAEWAARSGDGRREQLARKRLEALEPRLVHLMIEVAEQRGDVQVTLDGQLLGVASLATALPVDPGQHVLAASAEGAKPWSLRVHVPKSSDVVAVRVPRLTPIEATPVASESSSGDGQQVAGWLVGAVGVAGLVVTAVQAARASSQADDADAYCQGRYCTPEGLELHDDAHTSADVATAAFFIGIACVGVGITLLATAPSDDDGQAATESPGAEPAEAVGTTGRSLGPSGPLPARPSRGTRAAPMQLRLVGTPTRASIVWGLRW